MNVKSEILKLSILFMLILVLIPAVAAEDSSESFYIEYAEESEDVIVEEEPYSIVEEEVEYAPEETSVDAEINEEYNQEYISNQEEEYSSDLIEENNEVDVIIEQEYDCSCDVTHDIIETENTYNNLNTENITDITEYDDDIDEYEDELTNDDISVINQGSLFISKHEDFNIKIIFVNDVLYDQAAEFDTTSCVKRSILKFLELKNNILINLDVKVIFMDDLIDGYVDGDLIKCINKVTSDFVFSIDNSVIGDEEDGIFLISNPYFLNFTPCFNVFICCDFLTVELFFRGDFIIASELFSDFVVEYSKYFKSYNRFLV